MDNLSGLITASKLVAVLILVLANGFFVAAEFALVALRRSRVDQLMAEKHPLAMHLQRAVHSLDAYLAATQLGITMSSLSLGWLGEPAIATLIEPAFHLLPEPLAWIGSHTLAVAIAFIIITSLHIVLGELAPKSLALQRTETTALAIVKPLELYLALFRPAVYFLNSLGNRVVRLLGLQPISEEELIHSIEELKLLIAATSKAGLLGEAEQDMVERVFRLGSKRVSVLMTPRLEIVWLDLDDSPEHNRQKMINSVHSRFLVCQGSLDNILGVVSVKDLLASNMADQLFNLTALLKQPLFAPESMRALKVLELFKQTGNQMGLVVDEYGVMQGLITLNDILEAIVGDIPSLDELEESAVQKLEDGLWLLDGMLPIDEFKELFNINILSIQERGNYQTLGGFMIMHLGRIPSPKDYFEWDGLRFEVKAMDGKRVDNVLVMQLPTKLVESSHKSH